LEAQLPMRLSIFSVADHYPDELPRTLDQLYGELLDLAVAADALGFHGFWVAEHHFHPYGAVPRPALLLTAVAQRTRRIRLGSAVCVLPFDHPVRTAEDYAMLDLLSGGRLDLGVGSGYLAHELAGFAIPSTEKRERFDEGLDLLQALWRGERVRHRGTHHSLVDVRLNVLPLQKPQPPIWIAALREETLAHVAAKGMPALVMPYATFDRFDQLHAAAQQFHARWPLRSEAVAAPRLACGLHAHCAETLDEARMHASGPLARYVRTRLYARQRPLDELMAADLVAIGNGEQLRRLVARCASAGLTDLLLLVDFGGMRQRDVLRSLEQIAHHLLP